ncbi:MAG: triosephosphate isomerase [Bacilli bacterium]|nr:triosephosphate isomerase [Bacilli bacterium]
MKLLICNWKENMTLTEALKYKKILESVINNRTKIIICPSFPFLPIVHSQKYLLGAQDVSEFEEGNYTGEVSAKALKSLDVKYVIIGHHERETYFLENYEKQKRKMNNALKEGLKVILPVGENLMEYQLDKTESVINQKLTALLTDVPVEYRTNISIAYEPVWKIGSEQSLSKKEIIKRMIYIKKWLYEHNYPNNPVLYGGGIQLEDIQNLPEIDGFLLGTLSLNVEKMCQVIQSF